MPQISFIAPLVNGGSGEVRVHLPADSSKKLGVRARTPVAGSINGYAIRASIVPAGDGSFFLPVNKAMQRGAAAKVGDKVKCELDVDTAPRKVEVPEDLKEALTESAKAKSLFNSFPFTHKKAYIDWIDEAKHAETRSHRIAEAVRRIAAGKKMY